MSDQLTRPPERWVSQGDIFSDVPLLSFENSALPTPMLSRGPAMLITHGCALDKKTRTGQSTIQRLHFLPVRSLTIYPSDQRRQLVASASKIQPFEVIYLGEIGEHGEVIAILSEPVTVPASFFALGLTLPEGSEEGEERLTLMSDTETRIATLTNEHSRLLSLKLNAYWTRSVPEN